MPNDFINTITTNDGTTYDVQDKRLTVTAADVGKVVAVDENGDLELVDMPASGSTLYCHRIVLGDSLKLIYIVSSVPVAYLLRNFRYNFYIGLSCVAMYGTLSAEAFQPISQLLWVNNEELMIEWSTGQKDFIPITEEAFSDYVGKPF